MATSFSQLPKNKQQLILAGGAAVILGVGYWRWKQNQSNNAAAGTAADQSNIDPATGYVTGSAEDIAALQAQQATGSGTPGGTFGGGGDGGGGTGTPTVTSFVDNAAWTQAATVYLSNLQPGKAAAISAALGKYVEGQPLSPAEVSWVNQAIAAENLPPIAGPGGFPPHYKAEKPSGGPTPPKLASPHLRVARHIPPPPHGGGNSHQPGGHSSHGEAVLTWNKVPHAQRYIVHSKHTRAETTDNTVTVQRNGDPHYVVATGSGYRDSNPSNQVTP